MDASEQQDIQISNAAGAWPSGSGQPAREQRHRAARARLWWNRGDSIREGQLSRQILRRDALYRRYLALSDFVATYAAVALAVTVAGQGSSFAAIASAPLVVLLAKMFGLYERDELLLHKTTLDETPTLFHVATIFTLGVSIARESLGSHGFATADTVLLWALLTIFLVLSRAAARRLARRLTEPERCLVIGNAPAAESLKRSFGRGSAVSADIVGRIPLQYGRREGEDPPGVAVPSSVICLGELDELSHILREYGVDRVLIVPGAGASDELLVVTRAAKALGARVSVVPRLFEVVGSSAAFDYVEGTTLLGLRRYGLSRSSWRLKRTVDLVGAALALIALCPLLLAAAIAIKLDDRGPILFRQRRIGRAGHEFEMLKFRTMSEDAEQRRTELEALNEAEGLFKIADDPRITRAGQFLRRTSLDEIPQLLNVLRGEMSLVGPRPLIPDDDQRVRGWERRRLNVPPGMTGHWQILGSSRIPLGEMVKIDYLYGANWSLWRDVKILLRTVPYVLARRGQ